MSSLTEQLERTHFHDSSLGKCFSTGDTLQLQFRNISLEPGKEQYYSASIIFEGVREIRRNGKPIPEFKLESNSSGILQFRRYKGTAVMLVEWDFFQPSAQVFTSYEIDYETSEITAEMQDDLIV